MLKFILIFLFMQITNVKAQALQTVSNVDLTMYAGKWYEIASYPQRFQRGCHCTTAEYTLSKKGFLIIENKCNRDSITGKESSIKGKGFVEKNSGNAKIRVRFFWPFYAQYWIIDLANDYSYAVVSHPNRKYLWMLCRTNKMDDLIYQEICARLVVKGFDLSNLKLTKHF